MQKNKQDQIDPSIYQYDQVYDHIKQTKNTNHKTHKIQKNNKQLGKPKSKYINSMKNKIQIRKSQHQRAHQKILQKQNAKLNIGNDNIYITQSYLKKQQQEKQKLKKQKQQQQYDHQHSIANQKMGMNQFKKKLLDDDVKYYRPN